MVIINHREYSDPQGLFQYVHHEEYFNLKIIPLVGILELEIGLLNDLAESFGSTVEIINYSKFPQEFIDSSFVNILGSGPQINIARIDDSFTGIIPVEADVILSIPRRILDAEYSFKVLVHDSNKVLYLKSDSDRVVFQKAFWYYFDLQGVFKYSNLICYSMIIKNGGELLEKVLTENLPIIDRWCILDTGSTDGSQDVIRRVLANKKGTLYEEPFVNFKVSRNRCLDLCGKNTKFILTLDDSYTVSTGLRDFLTELRGDQYSDSFSLLIKSDDTEYYSNRIIKSESGLRYIHTIHEVITDQNNINVTIPLNRAFIFDYREEYLEKRTNDRKQFDLSLLFQEYSDYPDDPRALYYIAQTYSCLGDSLNKAKYFELRINHPVQGYVQEKIDSLFELARIYNFDPKLSREWGYCEKLYLQAFELDQKRPDSLYFVGIHYYLLHDYPTSYRYFKQAFEIGYPLNSQYSLKPTLSFHFLPKFLAEVCYYQSDFVTGKAATELFLTSPINIPNVADSWNLMVEYHKIFNLLVNTILAAVPVIPSRKIFCIVTDGGWSEWTGKDILTKGMGGSETWIIETARVLHRILPDWDVVVFCKCSHPEFFEGVGYNPVGLFNNFIGSTQVEYCLISRFPEYIPLALYGYSVKVGIIFHDLLSPEIIIPVHKKLTNILGLSEWHSKYILGVFPQFSKIIEKINYGINLPKPDNKKIKNSFIYSSFPNRGLLVLLQMWPFITKAFPDATLNIYSDVDGEWVNRVAEKDLSVIRKLLKMNKTGINYHSWVSKEILAKAFSQAEYFLYPCTFEETFCMSAVEAAISKTFVISNNLAGLSETVGDRGLIVHGKSNSLEWQELVLVVLFKYMSGKLCPDKLIEQNYQWAVNRSWETQTRKLISILGINKTIIQIGSHVGDSCNDPIFNIS